jgi:predicted O-methyltransferase YrrM
LCGGRPIDLLIIDADHSYGGVRSDYEMYAPLVGAGGLIALHDIVIRPENSGRGFDVGLFWDELRERHDRPLETLVDPNGAAGLLARPTDVGEPRRVAFGWGLVTV